MKGFTMKRLVGIILALAWFSFQGCNGATDSDICAVSVKKAFPKCIIYKISDFKFIVVDTSVAKPWPYYVETNNILDAEISKVKVGALVK